MQADKNAFLGTAIGSGSSDRAPKRAKVAHIDRTDDTNQRASRSRTSATVGTQETTPCRTTFNGGAGRVDTRSSGGGGSSAEGPGADGLKRAANPQLQTPVRGKHILKVSGRYPRITHYMRCMQVRSKASSTALRLPPKKPLGLRYAV